MRILVADDEADVRKFLKKLIESKGHEVVITEDGQKAWDLLKKMDFDVLVSDLRMPKLDGLELFKKFKEEEFIAKIDFILISGFTDIKNSIEAVKMGIYDYFRKPIDTERFLECIDRIEEKKEIFRLE